MYIPCVDPCVPMQRAVEQESWAPQFFKFVLDLPEILPGNMSPSPPTWDERATYDAMQPLAGPATPEAAH